MQKIADRKCQRTHKMYQRHRFWVKEDWIGQKVPQKEVSKKGNTIKFIEREQRR